MRRPTDTKVAAAIPGDGIKSPACRFMLSHRGAAIHQPDGHEVHPSGCTFRPAVDRCHRSSSARASANGCLSAGYTRSVRDGVGPSKPICFHRKRTRSIIFPLLGVSGGRVAFAVRLSVEGRECPGGDLCRERVLMTPCDDVTTFSTPGLDGSTITLSRAGAERNNRTAATSPSPSQHSTAATSHSSVGSER